jgi:hypothetical protein
MPLCRIELECINDNRWVGEIEVGGLIARRARVTADTLRDALVQVAERYGEFVPAAEREPQKVDRPALEMANEVEVGRQREPQTRYFAPDRGRGGRVTGHRRG